MVDRPLRFCMVTTYYPPYSLGGDAVFVRNLSNELAQRGHHVEVIHCLDSFRLAGRPEPNGHFEDHPNVTVHGLESRFGFLSPLATHQLGRSLLKSAKIRAILNKGFDVIHYHNVSLVGGPGILALGRGIKLYTMHEYWLVCPTHVLYKFNREPCEKPACFRCSLTYRRPPQAWRYGGTLDRAVKQVDAFLAPSRFCKAQHERMGFQAPIVHLPSFVPEAGRSDHERAAGLPEEIMRKPYFLFVGRLEQLKGLQTVIPVFRRSRSAQLLIAGEGSYGPELRRLAHGSENIHFLGHRSSGALRSLYQGAVAIIVPSLTYEIMPMVMLEAFSHGTPAIARNIGSLPELMEESGGGFIYRDDEGLTQAMDRLLTDPSCRERLGGSAYEACQRTWTPEAHLRRYFALLEEIAERRQMVVGSAVS